MTTLNTKSGLYALVGVSGIALIGPCQPQGGERVEPCRPHSPPAQGRLDRRSSAFLLHHLGMALAYLPPLARPCPGPSRNMERNNPFYLRRPVYKPTSLINRGHRDN